MADKSTEECLRKIDEAKISLADLVNTADFEVICYGKHSCDLEDPVGTYGWCHMEGVISDERIEALEAGAKSTAGEMQLFRDKIVRERFSVGEWDDCPGAYICSPPKGFESQLMVIFVCGSALTGFEYDLFGLFDNMEQAKGALRKDFFLDCDLKGDE